MLKGHSSGMDDTVAGRGFGQQQGVGVGTRMGMAASGQRLQEYAKETLKGHDDDGSVFEANFWMAFDALTKYNSHPQLTMTLPTVPIY